MLYNRTPTKLYVLYLVPHKNQLTIEKIKKCSTTIHRSNPLISSLIVRQFRTKVEQAASSGLGRHSAFGKLSGQDDKQEKRFSFFKFFNPNYLDDHRLKNIAGSSKSIDEEKNRIKIAFAEGYLAGTDKGTKKKFTLFGVLDKLLLFSAILGLVFYFVKGRGIKKIFIGSTHEISPEEINVTFSDALGIDEAKEELKEIVEFLRDPDKFTKLGGRLPRGVLLVGPPGTGKTLLARAIAGEANVPFFHAAGSEFDEILVGQGARRIRDLFAAAKSRSPCVVFIDEIDSVGGKRTNSILHPYANQTINQLLSEMDGFRQNEGVIVLGATNRRNDLDTALLRPGRFDVQVTVSMPDLIGRKEIFAYYLGKLKLTKDISLELLAKRTLGFSGADIENMCNQAALKAAIEDEEGVSMKHLNDARDKILMGPEKKRKIPDEEVNRFIAYHEAGHTLVAYYNKNADPIHKVTIIPRGQSLGSTAYIPEKEYQLSKAMMLAKLDIAMGGRVAEELIFGEENITSGAYSDLQSATDIARTMVKDFGMSTRVGLAVHENKQAMYNEISNSTMESIELEVKRLLNESYERAKKTLKTHNKELHLLAEALLKYETLDLEQIKQVVEGPKLKSDGESA